MKHAQTAVVAFVAAFAGAGVVAMMGQGNAPQRPTWAPDVASMTEAQLKSLADIDDMLEMIRKDKAECDAKSAGRTPFAVSIPSGGSALVVGASGRGYIVTEAGTVYETTPDEKTLGYSKIDFQSGFVDPTMQFYLQRASAEKELKIRKK